MGDLAYVNGRFMDLADAMVPVEDRGLQFGDGVYEVIRTYGRQSFQVDAHLARLTQSAAAIGLMVPEVMRQFPALIDEGVRRAGYPECKVYLQITRGVAPRDHAFPARVAPTVVMTFRLMRPLDPMLAAEGVTAMTTEDLRWGRCDIKSLNLLANVLARQGALERGAFEALLVRNGRITEGTVSNVMLVRQGGLRTAPIGPEILAGITRHLVLELARKEGLPLREDAITLDELRTADEVFLTGTTVEVLPVVKVDETVIGSGRPGPISRLLQQRFQEAVLS
ncbi:MAG: D-amino-acid transaminase [Nitrospiraceae bacterium]